MNYLKAHHRQGLSTCNDLDHKSRIQQHGSNRPPSNESIFKKSVLEERDFMINFLFYLLTLRICVQMLLLRDQFRGVNPLGPNTVFHIDIWEELVSYLLLVCMIVLKAYVSVEYFKMDMDERKYKNEKIWVKRDSEFQQISEEDLLVGDIMLVEPHQLIKIDGIVLSNKNIVVSEAHTILKEDTKVKTSIFNEGETENADPFILAGSYIISGSGELLVCTVGEKCSFRINKENTGYHHEYTPVTAEIKRIMNKVERIAKILTLSIATVICVTYIYNVIIDPETSLSWIDLLYALKVYCGFIGLICFIQRLKIIKSLQFFIEANKSDKEYRIRNRSTFEKLAKLEILFIESETLAMRKVEVRGSERIELDNMSTISELNHFCQVKIVTKFNKEKVAQIFGSDIDPHCFFEPNEDVPYSHHVRSLVQATFLTETSSQTFVNDYLPIYKALGYEIGYLYDSETKVEVPSEILQINFQRLKLSVTSESTSASNSSVNSNFWVKLQNKLFMEDVLEKLFLKSKMFESLLTTYMSLYINNIITFTVLCYFSATVTLIGLSWFLLVTILHRYLFFMVYQRMTKFQNPHMMKRNTIIEIIKFNVLFLPYYLFVSQRVRYVSSIFLFFIVNAMVRVEVLLWGHTSMPRRLRVKTYVEYLLIYILAVTIIAVMYWDENDFFIEMYNHFKLIGGLAVIFSVYGAFL